MSSPNTFIGEYYYTLDSKGRVNIPAKFRNVLSEDNKRTFVITKGMDKCVVAYPLVEWLKVEEGLRNLSSTSRVFRSFVRSTVRYATSVSYDKQGRIQITQALRDYAELDKEILIIGMVNKIEIWNTTVLDELEKTSLKIDPEEYENLVDRIIL